jgi:hypothetical protein
MPRGVRRAPGTAAPAIFVYYGVHGRVTSGTTFGGRVPVQGPADAFQQQQRRIPAHAVCHQHTQRAATWCRCCRCDPGTFSANRIRRTGALWHQPHTIALAQA